ncbi:MAG: fumarate hydratase [Chloroflexi bacterium]|nr:fumarate hydratase [Chloroflexota bacterium]
MITNELVEKAGYEAMRRGVTTLPGDIFDAMRSAYAAETSPDVRRVYERFFDYVERRTALGGSICPDTGTIMYYVSVGSRARVAPDVDFWRILAGVTGRLTEEGILARKSGDPLRHINNNTNVGVNSPSVQYQFVPGVDYVEITAVAKGGGGEIMGSKFRMLTTSEPAVIKKYILDSAVNSARNGFNCPPAIYGVGIGGGLAIAGSIANEAAVLRPVGSRHPEAFIAGLENELLDLLNSTGIGPAGLGGQCTALDVHVEYSHGHEGVIAVGIVSQCLMAHRATVRIMPDGSFDKSLCPQSWFVRPWASQQ